MALRSVPRPSSHRRMSTIRTAASSPFGRRHTLRSLVASDQNNSNTTTVTSNTISNSNSNTPGTGPSVAGKPRRSTTLPAAHSRNLPDIWFNAAFPLYSVAGPGGEKDHKPPDERTVKLGKTLRILQERLPTLMETPLPAEILSPTISLHLFPSTHPHLPVVRGRVAYIAALWTSPLAWNRLPLVGNVRLEILSERMSKQPLHASPRRPGAGDEQLVVRWRTIDRHGAVVDANGKLTNTTSPGEAEFTGLFIFEFDGEGRILSHTIEHVEESGDWERSVGARFVALTDWLLGGMKGGTGSGRNGGENTPLPAFEAQDPHKLR